MSSESVWAAQPLTYHPEYAVLQDDLAYMVEQVREDARRLPALLDARAEEITLDTLLPARWDFAEVALVSWLGHALGASDEVRRHALVAICYIYQYVLGFDRLMDTEVYMDEGRPRSLLGIVVEPAFAARYTVMQQLALWRYQHLFAPESPFWTHLIRYTLLWTEYLRWEREPSLYRSASLDESMRMESSKGALFYATSAAATMGSGRPELLPALEHVTMVRNMAMNLVDDCDDWEEDVAQGRHNSFVKLAAHHGFLPSTASSPADALRAAIYTTPLLDVYVAKVDELVGEIESAIEPFGPSYWRPFLEDLRAMAHAHRSVSREKFAHAFAGLFSARVTTAPDQ